MHDRDKDTEQLNTDELAECKSLSQDAEAGSFTLEDILAEYGTRRSTQRSAVPVSAPAARAAADTGKVVAFPGRTVPPPEEEPEAAPLEADGPVEEDADSPEDGEDGGETGRVVDFPEEESVLSAFLKDITRKADRYAAWRSSFRAPTRRRPPSPPAGSAGPGSRSRLPPTCRPRSWPAPTARG